MTEVWKDIAGYESLYQVSTLGNVKSLKFSKERLLRPGMQTNGYLYVHLYKDGKHKNYDIQQLVAKAFISNHNGYPCVHHKNEVKTDNRVENLEWVSHQYNLTYNDIRKKAAKKISKPVYCIELDKTFQSSMEAERQTGIFHSSINMCLKGRLKSAGGFHWTYAEK